jgi:hypothetical protein
VLHAGRRELASSIVPAAATPPIAKTPTATSVAAMSTLFFPIIISLHRHYYAYKHAAACPAVYLTRGIFRRLRETRTTFSPGSATNLTTRRCPERSGPSKLPRVIGVELLPRKMFVEG